MTGCSNTVPEIEKLPGEELLKSITDIYNITNTLKELNQDLVNIFKDGKGNYLNRARDKFYDHLESSKSRLTRIIADKIDDLDDVLLDDRSKALRVLDRIGEGLNLAGTAYDAVSLGASLRAAIDSGSSTKYQDFFHDLAKFGATSTAGLMGKKIAAASRSIPIFGETFAAATELITDELIDDALTLTEEGVGFIVASGYALLTGQIDLLKPIIAESRDRLSNAIDESKTVKKAHELLTPFEQGIGAWLCNDVLPRTESARNEVSPLVLDLDGDGIELAALGGEGSVYWDVDLDGFREASAWVLPDDGLLVLDSNGDGLINDHSELFGNMTTDGFSLLARFDGNADAVIDTQDTVFSELQVWRDSNGDGISQTSEMASLSVLGIVSISLDARTSTQVIAGNRLTHQASFTRSNGTSGTVADVWFAFDNVQTIDNRPLSNLPLTASLLPALRGYGRVSSLHAAMSRDGILLAQVEELALTPAATLFNPTFGLETKFRALLYRWAGVDQVDSASRGRYIDGRSLAFLEALTDEPFLQRGSPNPYVEASATLQTAMEKAHDALLFRFVAQAGAATFLTGYEYYEPVLDEVKGTIGIDFARLQALVEAWHATGVALSQGWSTILRIIDGAIGIDALTEADQAALNAMIRASDPASALDLLYISAMIFPPVGLGLNGTNDADRINGGSGNDSISSGPGNDTLRGLAGNDWLDAGAGNDTLAGEGGDDTLLGDSGNDTYIYSSGLDTVWDSSGLDAIQFGTGVTLSKITIRTSPTNDSDGHIHINGVLSLIIEDMFLPSGAIETFRFADGSIFDAGTLIAPKNGTTGNDTLVGNDAVIFPHDYLYSGNGNDRLSGGLGDDRLFGGSGADTYVVTTGHDRIYDESGAADRIEFGAGYTLAAARFTRTGDNLTITFNSTPAVTIQDQFDGDGTIESLVFQDGQTLNLLSQRYTLVGTVVRDVLRGINTGGGGDILRGLEGDDTLFGYGGNDEIDGGAGSDWMDGGYGDDRYIRSIGHDTVVDGGGVDTIVLGNVTPTRLRLTRTDADLTVAIDGVDAVTIRNQFSAQGQIETLTLAGNTPFNLLAQTYTILGNSTSERLYGISYGGNPNDVIRGMGGADRLYGDSGSDLLDGGDGDDQLYGGIGNDRYEVGGGANYVSDDGNAADTADAIVLPLGVLPSDVTLIRNTNRDLLIAWGRDSVVIDEAYDPRLAVERLVFSNGESWNLLERSALTLGTNASETLRGNGEALGPADDTIRGLLGNDILEGFDGADVLDGGGDEDRLYGGLGADSYLLGQGFDYIDDRGSASDSPDRILLMAGIRPQDVTLTRASDGDMLLDWGSGGVRIEQGWDLDQAVEHLVFAGGETWTLTSKDVVTIGGPESETINGNREALGSRIDVMRGMDGNDWLRGYDGDDRLDGGTGHDNIYGDEGADLLVGGDGDDELYGGSGNDIYIVGAGRDWINDDGSTIDIDTLRIDVAGLMTSQLNFGRFANGQVRVSWNSGTDYVTIYEGTRGRFAVEWIELVNGAKLSLAAQTFVQITEPTSVVRSGDATDNNLLGGDGNDQLTGFAGNDTLEGGNGDDELYGGRGADIYRVGSGDDYVSDQGIAADGTDRIVLTVDVAAADLRYSRTPDAELLIRWTAGSVRIRNAFDADYGIEQLVLLNGTTIDLTSIVVETHGSNAADQLSGNREERGTRADTIRSFAGDDELYGYDGADILDGGAGNDFLYGSTGGDRYIVEGHDVIYDSGAVNDTPDTIQLPAHLRLSDLTFTRRSDESLSITWNGGSVTITDAFYTNRVVEQLKFGDGSVVQTLDQAFVTAGSHASDSVAGNTALGSHNDTIYGHDGNDSLHGEDGQDRLIGGAGSDELYGGYGADSYVVGEGHDLIVDWGTNGDGADTILLPAGVRPGDVAVTRFGDGDLLLAWADASVRINAAWEMTSAVERIQFANGTVWQINEIGFETRGDGENETLEGNTAPLGSHDDVIRAFDGNDQLYGQDGRDVLDPGAGNDLAYGGIGDDTYVVGSGSDFFYEGYNGGGTDTIRLGADVWFDQIQFVARADQGLELRWLGGTTVLGDHLRGGNYAFELIEAGGQEATPISVLANLGIVGAPAIGSATATADLITGNGAANSFDGLAGNDRLFGGGGDDRLVGNGGNDLLFGGDGRDELIGGADNDLLRGGAGPDNMDGGTGDDVFYVDDAGDVVNERINEGNDKIYASVTYSLAGSYVETLVLLGDAAINATGNTLGNTILGNGANNLLSGGDGVDTVSFAQSTAGVVVNLAITTAQNTRGAGMDTITGFENVAGSTFADTLAGTEVANFLNGGGGADRMSGGGGNDTYAVDNIGDTVAEGTNAGTDTVRSSVSFVLGINIENLTLTGTGHINGSGNALDNTITGNASRNTLDGGFGADNMAGGAGDDTYLVDNFGDTVTEGTNAGTDTVRSSVTFVLGTNIENLTLTRNGNVHGSGNSLNNTLIGNAGHNTLNGGSGADKMAGGDGNDTYVIDNTGDLVTEVSDEGTDTILASVGYRLGSTSEIEFLKANAGANGLALTGNGMTNTITGGDGADVITGAGGADVLFGGKGADIFALLALTDSSVALSGRDRIGDFLASAGDRIRLSALDANTSVGGDQAFTFIGNAAFSGAGQVRAEVIGGTTVVAGNVNAALGADFAITLTGSHTLTGANFQL